MTYPNDDLISPRRLREAADNLAHGNRNIYPVDVILDAAFTIKKLSIELTAMVARARHSRWDLDHGGAAQDLMAGEKLLRSLKRIRP